jgi:hypothetical protein
MGKLTRHAHEGGAVYGTGLSGTPAEMFDQMMAARAAIARNELKITAAQLFEVEEEARQPTEEHPAGMLNYVDLAKKHGIPKEPLRKALAVWKLDHDTGYCEVSNPKRNQPKDLFDENAVMPVITKVKNRQQTTSGKNSNRKLPK